MFLLEYSWSINCLFDVCVINWYSILLHWHASFTLAISEPLTHRKKILKCLPKSWISTSNTYNNIDDRSSMLFHPGLVNCRKQTNENYTKYCPNPSLILLQSAFIWYIFNFNLHFFFIKAWLRYTSHIIKFTHLVHNLMIFNKYTDLLLSPQRNFRTFPSSQKVPLGIFAAQPILQHSFTLFLQICPF